ERVLQTTDFPLWIVANEAVQQHTGSRLLVLIEGDGTPWLRPRFVAQDPTSKDPLLLPLVAEVDGAVLYLGRPCYYQAELEALGQSLADKCKPDWWTFGRYSEPVVASLVEAVRTLADGYPEVVLLGHSGGATLAVLMAAELTGIPRLRVMTWAGNLDVDTWARAHGYSALSASLDPMIRPPLDQRIEQVHVAGGRDQNIQAHWIQRYAGRQGNSRYLLESEFDHRCCWRAEAKRLLSVLD